MRRCSAFVLLLLADLVTSTADQTAGNVTEGVHQVAVVVGQVVEQYLAECHLVLVATTQHSLLLQHISRQLLDDVGSVVVEAESLFSQDQPAQDHLLQGLWGEARHTCRALILHLTDDSLAFRFFKTSELWLRPETRLVIVGRRPEMEAFLHHQSLRNTKHILYFAVHLHNKLTTNTKLRRGPFKKGWSEKVKVYRRCLYCKNGGMDVKFNRHWDLIAGDQHTNDLFLEQPEDFMGHTFDILAIHFFPLLDLRRNSEELGTTYTPLDSVDIRMLNSFTAHANFTYKMRESWDGQYGMDQGNGNWTGIVGMLQHHQADIGLDLELTPTRIYVMDYSVLYSQETLAIFSLKPGLLPQHLAIIRPFSEVIWLALFVSFLVWCITLWLTQKAWSFMTDGQSMEFSSTFLYGWSVLMEEFSSSPTANPTGQVLVGLWMLACVILTNTYRSSLVAHLTVQDKMPAINSFQDLLARDGWGWGSSFANDASTLFFKHHPNLVMQTIYKGLKYAPAEEQFRRVLKGSYSHITFKNFGLGIVAASITDSRGYTPIYVGRTEYLQFLGFGFGFRRGAPFRLRISAMMQHLIEGGLIEYWIEDVISIHMRKSRAERGNGEGKGEKDSDILQVGDRNVSLGLIHLQGAFYLLLLGCGLAFLASVGEKCASYSN